MSAITAKASRKMKKYAVLTREPRCFLGSFDLSWEQRKAIDIADYSKGNGYSKGDLTDAGTPIILYGRLYTKYQFAISEVDTFAVPRNGAVYSQGNEVIVPASGETAEDIARASAVEKSGVLLGGDLNILRPFDFINPLFLALAISNGEPQKELAKKAQGKSVVHIHNTDIQEVTIAYPSRTEQDRIVSVFRQLDNLITLHQRKCALLFSPFQSFISMMFTTSTFSWEQRKFEEIAVRSSVICSDDTLPRVEYEDIVSGTGRLNKDIYAKQSSKSGIVFHQGDVLYGKLRPYLQNWLLPTFDGLAVGDFWVLQPQNADSSFLYRLIQSRQFDEVANQSTGTKMPRADWKLVSKTVFSIPSNISEQAAIGTYFTALDSLITLHQRKFEKLTNVKKSMLEKMFPQNGSSYPEIRFKGFTDPWEQRKLSEMCGTFEYGLNAAAKEFDGKNKYIRITDIDDASREFLLSDLSSPDICLDGMSKYLLSSGDIVFARTGASVGKTYIYRENDGIVYFAGFLIRAKVNQDNDAEFVFQSTLSPSYEKYIRITSQRSGQPGVNAQEYGEYDLFAPSKEEQQRIGHFLRGIDNLITLHQRELEKLQNIKKSMLEKMFV